ncbi:MAG TPA: HD domain-containing protein [Longimicrobium sp.]|nr:HD domain-containing protein [Longimicrobium sp.]
MAQQMYQKHLISLRAWLHGSGKHEALRALEFARPLHNGLRKDGVTPEFAHQVFMMNFARNFDPVLIHPDATQAVVALHDVVEDKNVSILEIQAEFGDEIANAVFLMTAPEGETPAQKAERFRAMAECPIASVGKAIDRVHNVVSMVGVFTPGKVARYIAESEELILPMMKAARRRFPKQIPVYEISKLMISTHIHNIRTLLGQAV